jgi:cytochrome c peroxidase
MRLNVTPAIRALFLTLSIWARFSAAEQLNGNSSTAETFSQAALLGGFDSNRDGRLDQVERATLRDAFGGVDVPMLPAKAYRYTRVPVLTHVDELTLARMDNTPDDNPLTDSGATLGRVLFYDKQLSKNNTVACASCHHHLRAFSDPQRFSVGFEGSQTKRNAMGLANLRFTSFSGRRPGFFWDERAPTLEAQILMPIQDEVEMGMELPALDAKLQRLPYYPPLFQEAFGSTDITQQRIAKAVAQFLRAMISFDSKFDRAANGAGVAISEDFAAFTAEENLGKSLFINGLGGVAEIGCAHCHVPPTFGMPRSFNNGLDLLYDDQGLGARDVPSNDPFTPSNDGKFKAPSLRNIELTSPYMHDGRFQTLQQVVEHYSSGVHSHPNLGLAFNDEGRASEQETSGFRLTPAQAAALVAFLKTLTDEAFVCDPRFSDPFVRRTD